MAGSILQNEIEEQEDASATKEENIQRPARSTTSPSCTEKTPPHPLHQLWREAISTSRMPQLRALRRARDHRDRARLIHPQGAVRKHGLIDSMHTPTQKVALLFPGQGSQAVGMGKDLARAEPLAAAVFQKADLVLGFSLSDLCWHGPKEKLRETQYTQPAILTHSIALWRVLKAHLPEDSIACAAGHSVGQISALVAVGALEFEAALHLVVARSQAMRAAGEETQGGMAAVLGLETETIERICRDVRQDSGEVWIANDNCPGQCVISGSSTAVQDAILALKASGARKVIPLAVSIPAHTPLMIPAQERFGRALQQTKFQDPRIPILGNVRADTLKSIQDIRADLYAQITSTVRWKESVLRIATMGVQHFLEVGTGNVLCGLQRRILPNANCLPLDQPHIFDRLPSFIRSMGGEEE